MMETIPVCAVCRRPPTTRFYGDRCFKCRSKQEPDRSDMTRYRPHDHVLWARGVNRHTRAREHARVVHHEGVFVRIQLDDDTARTVTPEHIELVYRPGEAVTDAMLPGLKWLWERTESQSRLAALLGMPASTMSGVAKRMRGAA